MTLKNKFVFCLTLLLVALSSCYDEANTYGEQLVDSAFRNVSVDTSTVVVTTVRMDSIETSGKSTLLIGRYTHDDWGTIIASSYVPFELPSYSTEIDEEVFVDSLILKLPYNGYFLGDTTKLQHFTVHRLTQQVVLNDNGYLYNTSSVSYSPEILGQFSFKPSPKSSENVEIRLSDELAADMLTRFHSRDESVSNSERFEEYFKGIVIIPDEQTSVNLQAFSVSDTLTTLELHYHMLHEHKEAQILVFSPNTSTQFNHIDHDRNGSLLENYLLSQTEIPSSELDNKGLIFSGLGWYSRLEFPFLNNLMMQGEQIDIVEAVLKIYPDVGSYSNFNALPDSIYLYIADDNNVIVDAVTDYLGSEVQRGTLIQDDTFSERTYYSFDVTTFMSEELGTFGIYKHNLQLVFNNEYYTKTFRNLTFGNQNSDSPITLQLRYKIYESY